MGEGVKKCSKCSEPKPLSKFRRRCKNRNGKKEYWNMGECMDCEKAYHDKFYQDNLEFCRKRGRESAKKRSKKAHIYNINYRKRNSKWWEDYMDKYRKENAEHIAKIHKPIARAHHENNRDELSDTYVIHHIIQRTNLKRADIEKYPKLIELVRQNKLLKRKINEANNKG